MDLKKLAPWNWFKKEDEHGHARMLPVHRDKHQHVSFLNEPRDMFEEMEQFFRSGLEENLWSSFNRNLPATPLTDPGLLRPYVDISANSKEYVITVEIPGVRDKDIQLEITDNTIIIKGEKRQEQEEQQKNFYRIERSYGSFQRVLSLPEDADQDNIQAIFTNGVLNITINRKNIPVPLGRAIPIKELK